MSTRDVVESSASAPAAEIEVIPDEPARPNHARALAVIGSSAFIGAVLTVLAWPAPSGNLVPKRGIDNNWQAALAMAADQRLHFGTAIVFNFGPLGFLTGHRLWFSWTAILSFLFTVALMVAVFAVLVDALRTRMNVVVAAVVAYVCGYPLAAEWRGPELPLVLTFVWSVRLVSRGRDARFRRWEWIAFGAIAGVMGLQKVSVGAAIGVLALVTVVALPSHRRAADRHLGASVVGVFLVGWLASGNRVGDIVGYVRGVREISSGYSTAMALDAVASSRYDVWLAVLGLVGIVAVVCLYVWRLETARRAQVGIVLATLLVTWVLFKEGFVRGDFHRFLFFASLPVMAAAFVCRSWATRVPSWVIVAGLLVPSLLAFNMIEPFPQSGAYQPQIALRDLSDTITTLALPARRQEVMTDARRRLMTLYDVPASMVARTAGQTVDIDPIDQLVAWVYPTMRWRPLPTIQDYNAYTPALDRLDVDFIASSNAPRFILRSRPVSVDGRLPFFDPPATQLAIACNYQQVETSTQWQLVERVPNRCGTRTDLGSVHAHAGDEIPVPPAPPGTITVATFDIETPLWWRVLDLAYKPPAVRIAINGQQSPHTFVVGTAGDQHILAVPPTLGYDARFRPKPIRSFRFVAAGGSQPAVSVHFSAVPIRE